MGTRTVTTGCGSYVSYSIYGIYGSYISYDSYDSYSVTCLREVSVAPFSTPTHPCRHPLYSSACGCMYGWKNCVYMCKCDGWICDDIYGYGTPEWTEARDVSSKPGLFRCCQHCTTFYCKTACRTRGVHTESSRYVARVRLV